MNDARDGLLRTLAFHHVWAHAPTRAEWIATAEVHSACSIEELDAAMEDLVRTKTVLYTLGRYAFDEAIITSLRERELFYPRKIRVARRAARWLASLSSVRFVALCNTTALGHGDDASDLDFFVVTRAGSIMATRAVSALPYKLLHRRPDESGSERDAICLSYFISDAGLDLSAHMVPEDDPYFRYWFLSLLPLYDDGVSCDLWAANARITFRHPFAKPWVVPPDLIVRPRFRIPIPPLTESLATRVQTAAFPPSIQDIMNRDTRVLVSPRVLKFHVNDRREHFRDQFLEFCRSRGIAS